MIDPDDTGDMAADVARRLLLTRLALGLSQLEFGRRAGLSQPQYHHFESGNRRLSLDASLKLCETYPLTLDWLFRGDPSGLPYALGRDIERTRAAYKEGASHS